MMTEVKRVPSNVTLSNYFPEIPPKPSDYAKNKKSDPPKAVRPNRPPYNPGRRKSGSASSGVQASDKGTQTNNLCMDIIRPKPLMDSTFPKKKKHPISHKIMLLSAVLSLAQKQKISGEVESTLLYYLHKEPVIKEAEDLCPMDEDKQAIAFRDIASKLPYPPYPLKIRGDQKSWLQKSIEEELGPDMPYLITGPEKWNRDFGATVLFGLHLVYTNHVEKEVPEKGLRFKKVPFELPVNPPKEWFAVDLCNNIKSSDVTPQDFTARMRRLVADGKLDSKLLLQYSEQFGDENTKAIVKDGTQVFLHQTPQFSSWLKQAAAYHKLGEFTILREYLVAHVLYSLQASGKRLFLKGGCSLSLGYNLINRTSEDIDLRIEPSMGVIWEVNGAENAEQTRNDYFLKLLDSIFIEDGEVELMHTKCKTTQALYHITFDLPMHHSPITIVLEVMYKVAPLYVPCKINSKFHQYARHIGKLSEFKQNYDFEIACVHPWQTLYEKIHAVHQNFNKFQSRCAGNINAPKWIRHLGDAYNIIRKTQKMELPEEWTIARLQEELAKSRDFVTDLSPDHPTLRHELLTDDERRQVEEAFAVHVEGAYYEVGESGVGEETTSPTLREVCETVIAWLRTVPTTFVSVDKFRRYPRGNYRGARSHHHTPHTHEEFVPATDSSITSQNRPPNNSYQRSYPSYSSKTSPTKPKYPGNPYNSGKNSYNRHYNSQFPPHPSSVSTNQITNDSSASNNVAQTDVLTENVNEEASEGNIKPKMQRQVDSSYRSGNGNFEMRSTSNGEAATDSNESNDESSNDSANEFSSNPESPSESSAESSNDHEFAIWNTLTKAPREPFGFAELLETRAPSSGSASEVTSESEPDTPSSHRVMSGTGKNRVPYPPPLPPPRRPLPQFNETSFGLLKRSSLPSPSPSLPTASMFKRISLPAPASPSTLSSTTSSTVPAKTSQSFIRTSSSSSSSSSSSRFPSSSYSSSSSSSSSSSYSTSTSTKENNPRDGSSSSSPSSSSASHVMA